MATNQLVPRPHGQIAAHALGATARRGRGGRTGATRARRFPRANPDLRGLTRGKARLLVLNKADLADDAATSRWLEYYRAKNVMAMRFNSNGGRVKEMLERISPRHASRPWSAPLRAA